MAGAGTWPAPYDRAAAGRLIERFAELGEAERHLATEPSVAAMLAAIGGNSSFLSDLAIREAASLRDIIAHGPDRVAKEALAELARTSTGGPRIRLAAAMRRAKRVIALTTAIADIGGLWALEQVTATLSRLADSALCLAVDQLLREAHDSGEIMLPDPARPSQGSGFTVLGMGKLGAGELNYSSDVDLVLLYDPGAGVYRARDRDDDSGIGTSYTRLARVSSPLWKRGTPMDTCFAPISACVLTLPRPRPPSRSPPPSPTMKAWVRTGSEPPCRRRARLPGI